MGVASEPVDGGRQDWFGLLSVVLRDGEVVRVRHRYHDERLVAMTCAMKVPKDVICSTHIPRPRARAQSLCTSVSG